MYSAIKLSANMSTKINLPVPCASISLPKRLKSGKKGVEIEEWNRLIENRAGKAHLAETNFANLVSKKGKKL